MKSKITELNIPSGEEIFGLMHEAVENYDEAIFLKDEQGRLLYVNKTGLCMLKKKWEDVKGKTLYELMLKDHAAPIARNDEIALRSGKQVEGEIEFPVNGIVRHFTEKKIPITDEKSEKKYILGISKDITEEKQTREALKTNREKYRTLVENTGDMIFSIDLEGYITYANPAAEAELGYPLCEMEGRHVSEYVNEEDVEVVYNILEKARTKGRNGTDGIDSTLEYVMEFRIIKKNGDMIWVSTRSNPVLDTKGNVIGIFGISRDITEKKKLEMNLKAINKELDDFAFMVSHDLKNEIVTINNCITIINEYPEMAKKYSGKLIMENKRLKSYLDRLLELSRAGRIIRKIKRCDIKAVFEKVFLTMTSREKVDAEEKINPNFPDIKLDCVSFETVFRNLIHNSIRYHDPEKEKLVIELDFEMTEQDIVLIYKDNGLGIEQRHIDKVLRAGFSFPPDKGTGFGLAIVRKIVKAHNGEIHVFSKGHKKGATFKIRLPDSV